MKDIIQDLQILMKYGTSNYPFQCEHDELYVHVVNPSLVSKKDIATLEQLGFDVDEERGCFYSSKYGSC